ncbi:MAG: glycosyltransferase family 4 protein [Candidatus Sumerlaeota bacterium]
MEWHAQDIADGLIAAGHTVSVITTPLTGGKALMPLVVNGTIIELGQKFGAYDPWFFVEFLRQAPGQVAALNIDVIHAQGFAGIAAERYLRGLAPIVTTIHGTLWSETPLREGGKRTLLDHWRFKHRHAITPLWNNFLENGPRLIVDSQFTINELERETGRKLKRPPTVVPLGFDLKRFEADSKGRGAARSHWGAEPNQPLLATIGRMTAMKNTKLIAKSFARLVTDYPNAKLIIGGDGPEHKKILADESVAALVESGAVLMASQLPAQSATTLLEAADLFVNADGGAPAFGLANAEALVMGTPVLAFDTGAHCEVVKADDGVLVPGGAGSDFAAAMKRMTHELPEPAEKRAARADRARQRFARELMIERLLAVYTGARDVGIKT